MHKLSLLILKAIISALDVVWFRKKSGWLFHGYNGEPIGNNYALAQYVNQHYGSLDQLFWVGIRPPLEELSQFAFRHEPERHASVKDHVAFMFFLMRFKIISLEGAGDLSFYLRFLPRRNRLVVLLPHGFNLKSSGVLAKTLTAAKRDLWRSMGKQFHLISAASRLEAYMISATLNCTIENVPVIGYQRATAIGSYSDTERQTARDLIISTYGPCADADKVVVYAPTHRDHIDSHNVPVLFGFSNYQSLNETLLAHNSRLIIRSHALGEQAADGGFSQISHASKAPSIDFNLLAPATDILITDYSGIFLEFLASDMKFAFWQYDFDDYREKRGFSMSESIFGVGKKIFGPNDFRSLLGMQTEERETRYTKQLWASTLVENTQSESLEKTVSEILRRARIWR
jgi:CDP-glycerol glycerophosphotransferase